MNRILTLIRVIAAAFTVPAFGIPTMLLRPFDRSGGIFQAFGRGWARTLLWICGIRVRVEGAHNIEPGVNYIYVSNHASLFDIPAVMAGIPDQIRLVYKKELEKVPLLGWVLKLSPYVTIDRDRSFSAMRSLELATERIRRGASVLLFAEGTRSEDGRLQPFKRGAFSLAAKTDKPIIPLTINGSYDRRPKGKFLIRPGTIELILDAPIRTNDGEGKEFELSLMNRVEQSIRGNIKEPAAV